MQRLLLFLLASSFALFGQSSTPVAPATAASGETTQTTQKPAATASPAPESFPGDSTKVEVLKAKPAIFPFEAERQGIQGQVIVKVLISEKGDVKSAEVVSGEPLLAKSALDTAKKWKFKPYIKHGKPVEVTTQLPFDFFFREKLVEKGVSPDGSTSNSNDAGPIVAGAHSSGSATESNGDVNRLQISRSTVRGMLIHKVDPIYPEQARWNHVQGSVVLHAVISKDGRIVSLKPISGPAELFSASIGAVQQWRYRPYIVDGKPIDVETEITVNFQLR